MPWIEVEVNIYRDVALQYVPDPNWRGDYAAYLVAYEAAPDKSAFNAEYFKGKQ